MTAEKELQALRDLESFINGRLTLDISDDMKSAYRDVRFLVRQHVRAIESIPEEYPINDLRT